MAPQNLDSPHPNPHSWLPEQTPSDSSSWPPELKQSALIPVVRSNGLPQTPPSGPQNQSCPHKVPVAQKPEQHNVQEAQSLNGAKPKLHKPEWHHTAHNWNGTHGLPSCPEPKRRSAHEHSLAQPTMWPTARTAGKARRAVPQVVLTRPKWQSAQAPMCTSVQLMQSWGPFPPQTCCFLPLSQHFRPPAPEQGCGEIPTVGLPGSVCQAAGT